MSESEVKKQAWQVFLKLQSKVNWLNANTESRFHARVAEETSQLMHEYQDLLRTLIEKDANKPGTETREHKEP